jgi:hypothetical protein
MIAMKQTGYNLLLLFIRPRRFWENTAYDNSPWLALLIIWCLGISYNLGRISHRFMKGEIGLTQEALPNIILQSWPILWAIILFSGAFSGILVWWIGGGWYRIRLDLASDERRAEFPGGRSAYQRLARVVYSYSGFVTAGPQVFYLLLCTMIYPNYQAAYQANSVFDLPLVFLPFWAVWVSYLGVITLFPVKRWKATAWFLILPYTLYGLGALLLTIGLALES